MTEDIVRHLRENWPNMTDAFEAADEIKRLRAELAAERERNEDLTTVYMFAFEKGRDAMRAELAAAERDNVELTNALMFDVKTAEAERDALRAQLDEAREALEFFANITTRQDGKFYAPIMRARAVLDKIKGGWDE